MPRYFFHFRNGGSFTDETGHELPDDEAVRQEAMRGLPAMAKDEIPKNGDQQGLSCL